MTIEDDVERPSARRYLDVPLANLGWVARDSAVAAAAAQHRPVVEVFPDAPSAIAFGRVAASVASRRGRLPESGVPGGGAQHIFNSFRGPVHAGV